MFLPVDGDEFNDSILTVLKVEPLMKFEPGADDAVEPRQAVHKGSKVPLWTVTASYEHDEDYEPENFTVRIPSASDPGIAAGPIRFGGLSFRTWNMNGKKGLSVSAESWTQDPPPSAKRAAATGPSKPPVVSGDEPGSKS